MRPNPTDDELLRSYLLGDLPDDEADRLEGRLLAEDELFELAEAVEAELLAAGARGELAEGERERVLLRLASSPRGRERLALARSLLSAARDPQAPAAVLPFQRRAAAPARPALRWAALAAALLAAAGLSWYALERPHGGESAPWIAQERPAPAHPVGAPGSAAGQPAPTKVVLQLALMTLRGAEPVHPLRVPPGAQVVELQLGVEGMEDLRSFHVTVHDALQGGAVWDQRGLEPRTLDGVQVLVLDLPAGRLPAGRYEIQTEGTSHGGGTEGLAPQEVDVAGGHP
jgi:hypothetical protein